MRAKFIDFVHLPIFNLKIKLNFKIGN